MIQRADSETGSSLDMARVLARAALKLVELTDEQEIFHHIAKVLHKLSGAVQVVVAEYDERDDVIRCRAVSGNEEALGRIRDLVGMDPLEIFRPFRGNEAIRHTVSGVIQRFSGGLHELSLGEIPHDTSEAMARLIGYDEVYGMGFTRGEKLLGMAALFCPHHVAPVQDLLETFGHQISAAILRVQGERARRALEEGLRRTRQLEATTRLAGGIAHELNNLLTVIEGNISLAVTQLERTDPIYESLLEVQRATDRGTELTHRMLAFSQVNTLELEGLDLSEVLRSAKPSLSSLCRSPEVTIELEVTGEPLVIRGDRKQIEKSLCDLALNAFEAMPGGGVLRLRTVEKKLPQPSRHGGVELPAGEYASLVVADTGRGMDRETTSRIFEPFFSTKTTNETAGLGLSVVYGVVAQHGGAINVRSEPSRGTTFELLFPLSETTSRPPRATPSEPPAIVCGRETILMAEDDVLVRRITKRILRRLGYHVLTAHDGVEALEVADRWEGPIHLLLTDVMMPRLNGKDLADRLTAKRAELKILFTSGYAERVIIHQGMVQDGLHFLPKPYDQQELADRVRAVLDEG